MLNYMEYIQRCFCASTNWNYENSYENILATPKNLLDFNIPSTVKLNISCKNTEYSYSSVSLSQLGGLAGSLAYLYSSIDLQKHYAASNNIPLQSVLEGYRLISLEPTPKYHERPTLLYGKMYFPSQFVEGMLLNRLSPNSQLLIKFINTPKLNKLSNTSTIFTIYYQRQSAKSSQDFIYSTNEALFGFRYLYNIGNYTAPHDTSSLSVGCELWYASQSLSPGLSTALRYSTHLSSSGKPLTMTLAINPLLGSIESTYSIKTDLASTFISKYSFNIYSYESDLSLGCDLWRLADSQPQQEHQKPPKPQNFNKLDDREKEQLLNNFMHVGPAKLVENSSRLFVNHYNKSIFQSSLKCNTSLNKRNVNFLWEGRFKDWLVSTGVRVDCKDSVPKLLSYGLELQYTS